MKGERSGYYGSGAPYYVTRSDTHEEVPDMLIIDPMSDPDVVELIERCGMEEWAMEVRKKWKEITDE